MKRKKRPLTHMGHRLDIIDHFPQSVLQPNSGARDDIGGLNVTMHYNAELLVKE